MNFKGRSFGCYDEFLDEQAKTLNWSGQHSDLKNVKVNTIVHHCNTGGRVMVGVREECTSRFIALGDLSHVSGIQSASFLPREGDKLIKESGGDKIHKAIDAGCLDAGLKAGVGLEV